MSSESGSSSVVADDPGSGGICGAVDVVRYRIFMACLGAFEEATVLE
jgi:hypothetical protein